MANNVNPFTGIKSDHNLETPNGYLFMDAEDGLIWGDAQIAPGVNADELYQQLVGKERPTGYREYLAKLKTPADDGHVDQVEAGSAAEVVDDDSLSQVVVTNSKALNFAEIAGFPGSVSAGAVELTTKHAEPQNNRAPADQVNLGTLGAGASKTQAASEQLDANGDTAETAAARQKADALAGVVQTGDAQTDEAKLEGSADTGTAAENTGDVTEGEPDGPGFGGEDATPETISDVTEAANTVKKAK